MGALKDLAEKSVIVVGGRRSWDSEGPVTLWLRAASEEEFRDAILDAGSSDRCLHRLVAGYALGARPREWAATLLSELSYDMDFDVRSQARRSLAIVTARLLEHVVGIGRPKDAGESDEASTPNLDPVYQKLRIILKQVAINTDVPDALALAEMISAITPTGAPRLVYEFATAPGPAQWRAVPGVVAWGGSDGRNLALRLIQENDTLLASVALVGLSVSGNDYSDDGPILESVTGHICSNDRDLKAQARRFLIKHAGKWTRENFRWIGTMLSMSIDNETDFVDLLRDASSASLSG